MRVFVLRATILALLCFVFFLILARFGLSVAVWVLVVRQFEPMGDYVIILLGCFYDASWYRLRTSYTR